MEAINKLGADTFLRLLSVQLQYQDPLEPMDHDVHVGAVIVGGWFAQDFFAGLQFVSDLLEPKLVRLMDDDEKHLIVGELIAFRQADGPLELEQLVDGEVIAVVLRFPLAAKRTLHRGSLAQRCRRRQSACPWICAG